MAQVYHIRTINGSTAPIPSSLKMVEYTLDMDSFRSASGLLNRNPLPTKKHKFFLEFPPMTKTEIQALLTMLNSESFTVTYENMITSTVDTGTFYCGDREISPIWIKNEANTDVLYDKFSINLIEY
jgi:hypothetical protein